MKHLVCGALILVFTSSTLLGAWALIPLRELVAEADLIVIGTLNSAEEDESGIGKGYIVVDKIVFGRAQTVDGRSLRSGDSLKIRWADNWACAAGMHMGRRGEKGVWMLDVAEDGTVGAGYPGKFQDLQSLSEIRQFVRTKETARVIVDIAAKEPESAELASLDESTEHVVDLSPWPYYSLARATFVLLLAGGLYILLYRSRLRIR